MRVVESQQPHDCLRVVVASLLELELDAVPWPPAPPTDDEWPAVWEQLHEWLEGRGWWLHWRQLETPAPFDRYLQGMSGTPHHVIASVTHRAFEPLAHVLVTRGDEVVLWPPTGTADPPLAELRLVGIGLLVAIDPGRFALVGSRGRVHTVDAGRYRPVVRVDGLALERADTAGAVLEVEP